MLHLQRNSKEVQLYDLNYDKTVIFRPVINEKVEERICGWGPSLEFYLTGDTHLAGLKTKFNNIFKQNYDAAFTYLKRFDNISKFYAEDVVITTEDVHNETSK